MKHILAWSRGKDSTASGILAKVEGWPLDGIITVCPDPFSGESKFIERFENFMEMPVEIISGPRFEDFFFRVKVRGRNAGGIYGWPKMRQRACANFLKWQPQARWREQHPDTINVVGIAANERRRLIGLKKTGDISYLEQSGITEVQARTLCIEYNLLHPLYQHFPRLGCVRCPKQRIGSLQLVRLLEKEKWQWALINDHLSPVTFRPDYTLQELEERFQRQPCFHLTSGCSRPKKRAAEPRG